MSSNPTSEYDATDELRTELTSFRESVVGFTTSSKGEAGTTPDDTVANVEGPSPIPEAQARETSEKIQGLLMQYSNSGPGRKSDRDLSRELKDCDLALDLLVMCQDPIVEAFAADLVSQVPSLVEKSNLLARESHRTWYLEYQKWKERRDGACWRLSDRGRVCRERRDDPNAIAKVKEVLPEYFPA